MSDKKIPICFGYQGKGNIGDDLMFLINTSRFAKVYVVNGRKIRDGDLELGKYQYALHALRAELLVFTGGNIFNIDRGKSYLKIASIFLLVYIRKILGKETEFASVGLNKNINRFAHSLAVKAILASDRAHLRETSIKNSNAWKQARTVEHIEFKPDIVFSGDLESLDVLKKTTSDAPSESSAPYAVFFPSALARNEAARAGAQAPEEVTVPDEITKVYVITQHRGDKEIEQEFFRNRDVELIEYSIDRIGDVFTLLRGASLIVTERYHGAILARRFGIPMIASGYSEKIRDIEMIPVTDS